jgi:hypothetical protein
MNASKAFFIAAGSGGGGGGFDVVILNDADPHVLEPGNEYQITASGPLTFSLGAIEGDSVRVRLMAAVGAAIGDYSVTFQMPSPGFGWFDAGNSSFFSFPVSTFFEWEYRTVGQSSPKWFLVSTNFTVEPLLATSIPRLPIWDGTTEFGDFTLVVGRRSHVGNNAPKMMTLPLGTNDAEFVAFITDIASLLQVLTLVGPLVDDTGAFVASMVFGPGVVNRTYRYEPALGRWTLFSSGS